MGFLHFCRNDMETDQTVIPARFRIAITSPPFATAAAAFVPVFFLVEELFCVFRVDVAPLPPPAPPPPLVSL